jgi:hypothetical protein
MLDFYSKGGFLRLKYFGSTLSVAWKIRKNMDRVSSSTYMAEASMSDIDFLPIPILFF